MPHARYIEISKSQFTLTAYADESRAKVVAGPWSCAIGKNPDGADKQAVGDRRTPEGEHLVVSVEESGAWEADGVHAYGPWFIRLKGQTEKNRAWTGIGIHGHAPGLEHELGTKASHGCMRVANEQIVLLKNLVLPGRTVVRILP